VLLHIVLQVFRGLSNIYPIIPLIFQEGRDLLLLEAVTGHTKREKVAAAGIGRYIQLFSSLIVHVRRTTLHLVVRK
jgi:hypothetical protein